MDNPTSLKLRGASPLCYAFLSMSQNIKDIYTLKRQFLEYMEIEKGRSLKTVENYDHYITRFLKQSGVKTAIDITESGVREFRLWLNRQHGAVSRENSGMKKNTQNYYMIALRTFLKYLISHENITLAPNKIELAKTEQRDLDLISSAELSRLLNAASVDTETGLRDRAILELLFSTGLRVSELCNLKIDDVDLTRDEFSVRGKGGKVRVVFISDSARFHVKTYLSKRKVLDERFFPITPRSIQRIIKHYAIKAGISRKVTPHVIRHVFATDLLSNGADLRSVQALLGHSNIATTQIYPHVTDKQLGEVHRAFHGKSLGKR